MQSTFGSVPATSYTVDSSGTSVSAISPAGTTGSVVDIAVTTPVGTSATDAADQFTYEAAPSVSAISPSAGLLAGQTTVTITGTNFNQASGASFGSSLAVNYTVISPSEILATSPGEPAGTVDVTVTTPVATSAISHRPTSSPTRPCRRSPPSARWPACRPA